MSNDNLRILEYGTVREILIGYAATPFGRRRIEGMTPMGDEERIHQELALLGESRTLLLRSEAPTLSELEDINPLLARVHEHGVPLEALALLTVSSMLSRVNGLQTFFNRHGDRFQAFSRLFAPQPSFADFVGEIQEKIDARGKVRDYATPRLTKIRGLVAKLRASIRSRLQQVMQSKEWSRHLQVPKPTVRGERYVLPIRADARGRVDGIIHDRSQTGSTFYVEPRELVEGQNEMAELRVQEDREVTRILWELTRSVLARESEILGAGELLAHVDEVQAKARFAEEFGMSDPVLSSSDRRMIVRAVRHPVLLWLARSKGLEDGLTEEQALERAMSDVVPFDLRLGDDFGRLVITGPNTGGKTVTLKAIGLISLMAQSGMAIPARDGSRIPLYDRVLADIGDEQSIQQSLSTFSGHVSNIAEILRLATVRSLVLLDELGAGTDPLEGGALGRAILEVLDRREVTAVITTHLGALKEFAYSTDRAENASVEFDDESLRPTFRLLVGQPGNSNALLIARRLGVPEEICGSAEEALRSADRQADDLIASLSASRRDLEARREAIEGLEDQARRTRDSVDQELREIGEKKETLSKEAEYEIDRTLRRVSARFEPVLARLRNAPKPVNELADELVRILDAEFRQSSLAEKRRAYASSLRKEDPVYLPRYQQTGRVRKVDKKHEMISVTLGSLSLRVPFSEVSWIEVDRS